MHAIRSAQPVALVTGASSGMGKAFAGALLSEGFTVYALARRLEPMEKLQAAGARLMEMDITREDDVQRVVQRVDQECGRVDVLVNNAGFGLYGAMEDIPIEQARYQFEVNLFGMARMTRAVLPQMRAQGAGRILNISSMGGKMYTPLGSWYHASKHAIEGWSDCLRLELKPFGIDVVIIEPGVIDTGFADVLVGPLLEHSGDGPYAGMAHAVAAATRASYAGDAASDPGVIVELVLRAIRAPRPRTRYVGGKLARPLMFLRKWGGDRLFDRAVMATVERTGKA